MVVKVYKEKENKILYVGNHAHGGIKIKVYDVNVRNQDSKKEVV